MSRLPRWERDRRRAIKLRLRYEARERAAVRSVARDPGLLEECRSLTLTNWRPEWALCTMARFDGPYYDAHKRALELVAAIEKELGYEGPDPHLEECLSILRQKIAYRDRIKRAIDFHCMLKEAQSAREDRAEIESEERYRWGMTV